jgi:tetratricopeptide (TPR) repeat protein
MDAKELYRQASEPPAAEGVFSIILDDEESYSFDNEGRWTLRQYAVYKVCTQQAVEGWSTMSADWEPWHESRPRIRARVIAPDYSVHELDEKTLTDQPVQDEENDLFSDERIVRAPLPAVEVGSVIEEEVEVQETTPAFSAGFVTRSFFGRISVPVQHTSFAVEAPSGLPLRFSQQLLSDVHSRRQESDGRVRVVFEQGPMPALEEPPDNLPTDIVSLPYVAFSTGKSWEDVAQSYSALVEARIAASDLAPEVRKLVKADATREEKIRAIIAYLNTQIRYTGVEFGSAAIIPNKPLETLTRRYGDCKDKSTLMVAMLRSTGIQAHLALLRAGGRLNVDSDLPGLGLFDHAIVYIPGEPDLWIDATDSQARLGELPISDQDRLALIMRPSSTELVRTPLLPPAENLHLEHREIYLADYGPARIVERTEARGSLESAYRRDFADDKNNKTRDNLTEYVKAQYLATSLDRFERSDPRDFSRQFELILESKKARRGFTDLTDAAAAIRLEDLFSRLPASLRQREATEEKSATGKSKAKRTADYLLPVAFVTEWRYVITPPAGFQVKSLPSNSRKNLGPCVFSAEFSAAADNTVQATLRFDTVKRRLSVAEADSLRAGILELVEGQPLSVHFEPAGEALLHQGKVREALHSYRELISAHPEEAINHLRMANALLAAGLGETAREEARTAVHLEPDSALAQQTLAMILEHDLVGRRLRPGSDYAGAEAAFRKAAELDPEDKSIIANLAILLEYNRWGLRYGPGARLKAAVTEYNKMTPEKRAEFGIANNLAVTLFYEGDCAEARNAALLLPSPPTSLLVACEASLNGAAAGIAEARKRASDEEQFREVVGTAGDMLENLRNYPLAADLKDAGASGPNASEIQDEAFLLRRTKKHEEVEFADDPAGAVLRFLVVTANSELTLDQLLATLSTNGKPTMGSSEVREALADNQRQTNSSKARTGKFADVGIDLSITRAQPSVQGNDQTGYKVKAWPSADYHLEFYVVREGGHYKVLANRKHLAGVGLEALDHVAAGELAAARTLFDWVREDWHIAGGDDPLAGGVFPRVWTKGREADATHIQLAAAALLTIDSATAARAIEVLNTMRGATLTEQENTWVDLALAYGYQELEMNDKALAIDELLVKSFPESDTAFGLQSRALVALHRTSELKALCEERLKRIPSDPFTLRRMALGAINSGDFEGARSVYRQLVNEGKASADDLNGFAWYSLFQGKTANDDLEAALKAAQLSNKNAGILHTLGCVYTELAKLKEAREVLIQAMDAASLDEPDDAYWYAFGRIAEQSGELAAARADYERVTLPKSELDLAGSPYRLAQARLTAMRQKGK